MDQTIYFDLGWSPDPPKDKREAYTVIDVENIQFVNSAAEECKPLKRLYKNPSTPPLVTQRVGRELGTATDYPEVSVAQWFIQNQVADVAILKGTGAVRNGITLSDYANVSTPNVFTKVLPYAKFSSGVYGGIPYFNHSSMCEAPAIYNPSTQVFETMPYWPANLYCKVLLDFKGFLIAFNLIENGVNKPTTVKWAASSDPGTLPTQWVPGPTNDAGDVPLSISPGAILDAVVLGDAVIIYKEDSVWMMQYIGGMQVFAFSQLPMDWGILAQGCVQTIGQQHMVVTSEMDVVVHNGVTAQSIIEDRMRKKVQTLLSQSALSGIFLGKDRKRNLAYLFYQNPARPQAAKMNYATDALVWNWKQNAWGHKNFGLISFCTQLPWPLTLTELTIDGMPDGTYDQLLDSQVYDTVLNNAKGMIPVFGTIDTVHETGVGNAISDLAKPTAEAQLCTTWEVDTGVATVFSPWTSQTVYLPQEASYTTKLEVSKTPFDNMTPETIKFIRQIFFIFDEESPLELNFGIQLGSDLPATARTITWKPKITAVDGAKINCTHSCRYINFKIEEARALWNAASLPAMVNRIESALVDWSPIARKTPKKYS